MNSATLPEKRLTHDSLEALRLMRSGRIVEQGETEKVLDAPQDALAEQEPREEPHRQCGDETPVVVLVMRLGVAEQEDLGVLLPFRVEALARHVCAHRRQQLDAERGHRDLQHGHAEENSDDGPVARQPQRSRGVQGRGHGLESFGQAM